MDQIVDPMLILLHIKFEGITRQEMSQSASDRIHAELIKEAKECERLILLVRGDKSDKLAEIYCLYSFYEL